MGDLADQNERVCGAGVLDQGPPVFRN
jgi:hypothetical protein